MTLIVRRALSESSDHSLPKSLHPVLHRVFRARQVHSEEQLDLSLARLLPYSSLSGIDQAVDLLAEMMEGNRRILIIADFDADGATSCALAIRALRAMGATQVDYVVPDRFKFGYGLTPGIVEVAATRRPDLIVTVDNGVSSLAGVAAAQGHGIKVLVTDHHLPGVELPSADAMVNPNLHGDLFPSKHLAGVGVIFYVLLALRARLRQSGWFGPTRPEPNMGHFLDLVALGTVADIVPLDHNNRILVEQGLQRIRKGQACPGILAILEIANRSYQRLVAADIGFVVGPRLNAAGRLEDMRLGIECLLSDDHQKTREIALRLQALNQERRQIEARMKQQALAKIEGLDLEGQAEMPFGLCLFDQEWHSGVVGILASRLKDRFHRPAIAFAPDGEKIIKGSARSVPGFHIRDALEHISSQHPGLLDRFGGHAMAAGMSLLKENLQPFMEAFDQEVRRHLQADDLCGIIYSDGALESSEMSLDFAEQLRAAGPWGQAFPEPVFDGEFRVLQHRVVGESHLKLRLQPQDGQGEFDAIAFNTPEQAAPRGGALRMAYQLEVNEYRNRKTAQLQVKHIETVV